MASVAGLFFLAGSPVVLFTGCKKADPTGRESLQKAEKHFAEGDYGSAEIEYKNTLMVNPREMTALMNLARIWDARGGPFQAAILFRNARNLDPGNIEARLGMAEFQLAVGDRPSARKEVLEVLKDKPGHPAALLLLAKVSSNEQEMKDAEARLVFPEAESDAMVWLAKAVLAMGRGDADAADQALNQSIELNGKDPKAHVLKARLLLARKDTGAAEECLKIAVGLAPLRSQERISYALFLLSAGRRDEAVSLLERTTEKAPDFIAAWRLLAKVALSANDHEKARKFLQNVYSWDATDFESNVLMAMLHLSEKDGEGRGRAIEVLEKLRTSHPPNALVEYYLGRARLSEGKTEQAIEALSRALRVEPEMRDAIILLAGIRLDERRFDEVVSILEPYLRNHSGDIDAILIYSEACRLSRSLQKSWESLSSITQEPDQNVRWHLQKALVLKDLGKMAEARSAFEKVEALDPSNKRAASELVALDSLTGNHAAALERAEKQLKLHPGDGSLFYMRATVLHQMSREDEAMNDLRKALQLDPKLIAAHLMISKLLSAAGKPDEALQQLEQARAVSPGSPAVLVSLVALHEEAGRNAEVRSCYEEILKANPNHVPALNNLAMILGESTGEDLKRAYQLAQQAITLSPDETLIADTLGWILYKKGEFKRAQRYLSEAAAKFLDDAMIQFHHGMSCLVMGDEEGARAAFRAAIAADPGFDHKTETEEMLARLDATASDEAQIQQHPLDMVARLKFGGTLESAGKFPEAAAVYEAALALNADLYPAVSRLAHLNIGPLNDPEKAYKYARQAAEMSPQDAAIVVILARLAFRDGEHERADVLFQNSLTETKGDTGLMSEAAWAAYSVGRVTDAKTLMQEVVSSTKDQAEHEAAKLFLDLQNPSAAAALIDKALANDPKCVPALMARADLAAKKDPKAALQGYEAALKIYPKFKPASEAAERIRAAEKER
jgi:tetratricopeptide (TPR) repeat protein